MGTIIRLILKDIRGHSRDSPPTPETPNTPHARGESLGDAFVEDLNTLKALRFIESKMQSTGSPLLSFDVVAEGLHRRSVAQLFYQMMGTLGGVVGLGCVIYYCLQ